MKTFYIKILTLVLLLCSHLSYSQQSMNLEWITNYIGDGSNVFATNAVVDGAGNTYVVGAFKGTVDFDPGAGTANLTFSGSSTSASTFVAKYNASGNIVWVKQLARDLANFNAVTVNQYLRIVLDNSGNFLLFGNYYLSCPSSCIWEPSIDFNMDAGVTSLTPSNSNRCFYAKYNAEGTLQWAKDLNVISLTCAAFDASGKIFLGGVVRNSANDVDPGAATVSISGVHSSSFDDWFFAKYDANGNFEYERHKEYYGNDNSNDGIYELKLDINDNIYIHCDYPVNQYGNSLGQGLFNKWTTADGMLPNLSGGGYRFVAKYNSAGTFQFAKPLLNGTKSISNAFISIDNSGNLYTGGYYFYQGCGWCPGNTAIQFDKLNGSGTLQFTKTLQSGENSYMSGFAADTDGKIYIASFYPNNFSTTVDLDPSSGTTPGFTANSGTDVFISVYDNSGNYLLGRKSQNHGGFPLYGSFNNAINLNGGNIYTASRNMASSWGNYQISKYCLAYRLTYHGNSATGGIVPAVTDYCSGATVTVAANSGLLTRTGFQFGGWNTNATGTGVNYAAGTGQFTMGSQNITLYARWLPEYTITFDANYVGGSVEPSSKVVLGGSTYGTLPTPTRTGYTFASWNTAANGSGTTITDASSVTITAAQTLYAQWTANTYTITYHANGGNNAPVQQSGAFNSSITLSNGSGLTRSGFMFNGWNTAELGNGTPYAKGAEFTIPANNTILYAVWTANAPSLVPYKTRQGGNFDDVNTWSYYDGESWVNATATPQSTNDIQVDHALVLNVNHTVGALAEWVINNTGSLVIESGYTLGVVGTANFGGRPVTLKSTATGTASIGNISNNGANLSGATSVTVERYIPAKRAWRLITTPLKATGGGTICSNWQNTGSGTGVTLFAPTGVTTPSCATNGIRLGGNASSVLSYNSTDNSWSAVGNSTTSSSLFGSTNGSNKSYAIYVIGPYGLNTLNAAAQATTLRPTGTLQTGEVRFSNLTAGQFHLIGNPYPSPVRVNSVGGSSTTGAIYLWDAQEGSFGAYKTWTSVSGWLPSIPKGSSYSNNALVQSGQAFLVKAKSAEAAEVIFNESDKVTSSTNNIGLRTSSTNTPQVRIDLGPVVNNVVNTTDAAIVLYDASFNAGVDDEDFTKFPNNDFNIAVRRSNQNLVIERRSMLSPTDTIHLRSWNLSPTSYQLAVSFTNLNMPTGLTAVLQDLAVPGYEQPLTSNQVNKFNFSVNNSNINVQDRFRIVFRGNVVTPVSDINGSKGFSVYPNPLVKGGQMQIEWRNRVAGKYTVTLYTITGVQVQQIVLNHGGGTGVQSVKLSSSLSTGTYIAEISGGNGVKENVKVVIE